MLVDSERKTYQKHVSKNGITHWRCSKYKSMKCHARATTEGNYVIKSVGQHNHWNTCYYDSWSKPLRFTKNLENKRFIQKFKFVCRSFWNGKVHQKSQGLPSASGYGRLRIRQD